MPVLVTHQEKPGTPIEVQICSSDNANDCVVVGHVNYIPVLNHWTATPKNAQSPAEPFELQDDAQLALIELEYGYWKAETGTASSTMRLLYEMLNP
jgi:hypothetical protein